MNGKSPRRIIRQWGFLFFSAAAFFLHGPAVSTCRASAEELRNHLLVVFNQNAADSEKLARYYAAKRNIPDDRVLGIDCPDVEEIDRATYDAKISGPLDAYLVAKGWLARSPTMLASGPKSLPVQVASQNDIWVIALIRGIPLRIQNDPAIKDTTETKPELLFNSAAVDSELAMLPIHGMPVCGPLLNPYYFAGYAREFDALDARRQILVARLDAPTAADVRRMIDETLQAENNRLTGFACIDARGLTEKNSTYYIGDQWLHDVKTTLESEGWPVEFDDRSELLPANTPLSHIALYAGWYEENAQGLFFQPPRRFATGAIAYHLHSFSAATLRSKTANWAGPLLDAGAVATMGAVYEPYLDFTPHLDIFFDRLLKGYTFAESAYMSEKVLSWMITVVGDPLYQPFREKLPDALLHARERNQPNLPWLELQQARLDFASGAVNAVGLKKRLLDTGTSEVLWEGYGDLLAPAGRSNLEEAIAAYRLALKLQDNPVDQIRTGQKLVRLYARNRDWDSAAKTLQQLIGQWPREAVFFGLDVEATHVGEKNVSTDPFETPAIIPPLPPAPPPTVSTSAPVAVPVLPKVPTVPKPPRPPTAP